MKHVLPCANREVLPNTGAQPMPCDNLEAWDGGGREVASKREIYAYLWIIHIVVQQNKTGHTKPFSLNFKTDALSDST